jgi:hypothetical protein
MSPVKYELGFYIPEDAILHSHRRNHYPYAVKFTSLPICWGADKGEHCSRLSRYEYGHNKCRRIKKTRNCWLNVWHIDQLRAVPFIRILQPILCCKMEDDMWRFWNDVWDFEATEWVDFISSFVISFAKIMHSLQEVAIVIIIIIIIRLFISFIRLALNRF